MILFAIFSYIKGRRDYNNATERLDENAYTSNSYLLVHMSTNIIDQVRIILRHNSDYKIRGVRELRGVLSYRLMAHLSRDKVLDVCSSVS